MNSTQAYVRIALKKQIQKDIVFIEQDFDGDTIKMKAVLLDLKVYVMAEAVPKEILEYYQIKRIQQEAIDKMADLLLEKLDKKE